MRLRWITISQAAASLLFSPVVEAQQRDYSDEEVLGAIYAAADAYQQSRADMERVARCESGLDETAYSVRGEMGLFQFHPETWAQTPYGATNPYDPWNNANAAAWMWSQGRKDTDWVCK
jgi:hypothetical protein